MLLDLVGVSDAMECAQGSVGGCVWTAIGFVPYAKLAKAAKLLKIADDPIDAGRLLGACAHSFDPDTPVLMADRTHKRIKNVQIGDRVVATNPETGTTEIHEVTGLHNNQDTDLVDLTIRTDDGTTITIHTTSHHPLWSNSRHDWINAADLASGDVLRALDMVDTVTVEAVRAHTGRRVMNDLTINQLHTYYVIAGDTPVLVHNTGPCDIDVSNLKFSDTVANHSGDTTSAGTKARPYNDSLLTVQEIMRGSTPNPDPGGIPGGLRWDTPGALNGKSGTWELVIDTNTNTVVHFLFRTG